MATLNLACQLTRSVVYSTLSLGTLIVCNHLGMHEEWLSVGLFLLAWLATVVALHFARHPELKQAADTAKEWISLIIGLSSIAFVLCHFWQYLFAGSVLLLFFAFLFGLSGFVASFMGWEESWVF